MNERARNEDSARQPPLAPDELESLRTVVSEVLRTHPEVRAAFLYGSAAEDRPFRDIDVGLYVDRDRLPEARDIDFGLAVTDELVRWSGRPIDARVVNDAPVALRYDVSRGRVLYSRSNEAAADFRERAWIEYFDFRPVALAYLEEAG